MADEKQIVRWHHAPLHVFVPGTVYMVTAGTLNKEHVFRGPERLTLLQDCLRLALEAYRWELRAWAVFSNHYHFVGRAPEGKCELGLLIKRIHSDASRGVNKLDGIQGRKVWHQYWDKCLTFEKSYLPRLKYVINNAVHHGLTAVAASYPFCSAAWFEQSSEAAFRKKVESFGCDRLNEPDTFDPVW